MTWSLRVNSAGRWNIFFPESVINMNYIRALFVFILWTSANAFTGGLRCYCNLPRCIPNGYMCKTANPHGKCFFTLENAHVTDQGCADLLADTSRPPNQCDHTQPRDPFPHLVKSVRDRSPRQRVIGCCGSHMCNHVEYTDPLEERLRAALGAINSTLDRARSPSHRGSRRLADDGPMWGHSDSAHASFSEQEMWFKAAVIAVPIAGGFIMLVLVFIAFRLLRQDTYLRRKSQYTTDPGSAHLLYANGVYSGPESWPGGNLAPEEPKQRTIV